MSYGEAGAAGVVACLLVFLVVSLSRKADRQQQALEAAQQDLARISGAIANTESITIKLIDRLNESDNALSGRHEAMVESLTQNTSKITDTIAELKSELAFVRGRINGGGK